MAHSNLAKAANSKLTSAEVNTLLAADVSGDFSITGNSLAVDNLKLLGNILSSTSGALELDPVAGSAVVLDSNFSFDGSELTSLLDANAVITAFAGKNITIEDVTFDGGVVGGVTQLTVDNLNLNGNALTSTSGNLLLNPVAGSSLNIDSHWRFDGNTLGGLTDNNSVITAKAGYNITIEGVTFDGNIVGGATSYVIPDGGTIGQAAGPLLTFDDTNNYLEIAGCNVGIGTTTPLTPLEVWTANSDAVNWAVALRNPYNAAAVTGYGVGLKLMLDDASETKWCGIAAIEETTYAVDGGLAFYTFASAAQSEAMRISGSGLVGIGTIPTVALDIVESTTAIIKVSNLDTVDTLKHCRFMTRHYNGVGNTQGFYLKSGATTSQMILGGATSAAYAVTSIEFYTAADTTTLTGTQLGYMNTNAFYWKQGILQIGADDTTQGQLTLWGDSTTNGGKINFYNSANEDTVVNHWRMETIGSSFTLGPVGGSITSDTDKFTFAADSNSYFLIRGVSNEICYARLGVGRNTDGISRLDLVGDTTHTDYGARFIRNGGANGTTYLSHRGTGDFTFNAEGAADIIFSTTGDEKMRIDASGKVGMGVAPLTNMAAGDLVLEGGSLVLNEITTPTADANYGKIYTKSDNKLYFQDGAGTEYTVTIV